MSKKKVKWSSDGRFRMIAEFLGPEFRPTTSEEIAEKLRRSTSLVDSYLRTMCRYLPGWVIYRCVYRLGPRLWAISPEGQEGLGLEVTAKDDCIAWLSVYCDAFAEGGQLQEDALDAFKWFSWRALKGDPIVFAVALELARHPWVNSCPARWKAISTFGNVVEHLEGADEAKQILAAVRLGADTGRKFADWHARVGMAGLHLTKLLGPQDSKSRNPQGQFVRWTHG